MRIFLKIAAVMGLGHRACEYASRKRVEGYGCGGIVKRPMMPRSIPLILGVCLSSLLFGQAEALSSISGTVADPQGRGVSAASVSLSGQPLSNPVETTSDSSGHFAFRDVKSGHYRVVVFANAFQELTRPIDTAQDGNKDLTLTLEVASLLTTVNVQGEAWGISLSTSSTGILTPVRLTTSIRVYYPGMLDWMSARSMTSPSAIDRRFASAPISRMRWTGFTISRATDRIKFAQDRPWPLWYLYGGAGNDISALPRMLRTSGISS